MTSVTLNAKQMLHNDLKHSVFVYVTSLDIKELEAEGALAYTNEENKILNTTRK